MIEPEAPELQRGKRCVTVSAVMQAKCVESFGRVFETPVQLGLVAGLEKISRRARLGTAAGALRTRRARAG